MAKPEMPTLRQEVPSNPLLIRPALGEIENSDVWCTPLCDTAFRVLDSRSPFTHPSVVPQSGVGLLCNSDSRRRPVCCLTAWVLLRGRNMQKSLPCYAARLTN